MKKIYTIIPVLLTLSACVTPIAQVNLPKPTVLRGQVHEITDDGFILKDRSGKIEVELEEISAEDVVSVGDTVTVKGVLDEDGSVGKDYIVAEEFDAYSITPKNGKEVVIVPYGAKRQQAAQQ